MPVARVAGAECGGGGGGGGGRGVAARTRVSVRDGGVFAAAAEGLADEFVGGGVGGRELGGRGGAVCDGVAGGGVRDVGFASDLRGAVWGDGGVLGGVAGGEEEDGVRGWILILFGFFGYLMMDGDIGGF